MTREEGVCSIQLAWQCVWGYHSFPIRKFNYWRTKMCLIKARCSKKSDNISLFSSRRILQWEICDFFMRTAALNWMEPMIICSPFLHKLVLKNAHSPASTPPRPSLLTTLRKADPFERESKRFFQYERAWLLWSFIPSHWNIYIMY